MKDIGEHSPWWSHAFNVNNSHVIKSTSNAETVEVKDVYEQGLGAYRHKVHAQHGDNRKFDSQAFKYSCDKVQHTYSYCVMGAHQQSWVVENMNKSLSHDMALELASFILKENDPMSYLQYYDLVGIKL
eukprot:3891993-Ditylum_brightwellii.AAC.1